MAIGHGAALAALLLAPLACAAQHIDAAPDSVCEQAYAGLPAGTLLDLLDPGAAAGKRADALAAYERLAALAQCPEFGYSLGLLYRHGEYLPGNLLAQDIDKARGLILPMAESGYLPAYADLAEMAMRHGRAREAMQWTQVYLHFVDEALQDGPADGDETQYQRSAYNGNLLGRVELIWKYNRPALPRKLVAQDLKAYLDAHGEAVSRRMRDRRQGIGLRASAQDGGSIHARRDPGRCYINAIDRLGAASAAWIVEVLPSGQPGRIVLENFVPKAEVADAMRECLSRYRFAPFESAAPQTIRIPMVMGFTDGASIRRGRR